jgi:hypothetical protein
MLKNGNVSFVDNMPLALALWVVGKMGPSERVRHRAARRFAAMRFPTVARPESDTRRSTGLPGFTPHRAGFTVEPNPMCDHHSRCVRSNGIPPGAGIATVGLPKIEMT